ncbi:MAG TPA: MarR family transcriptional regulator [Puia sp.]|jgi:DNA-binding MarR family transcriptional regulator|nr:MarR family transcriptional regulator [Puia sp.]
MGKKNTAEMALELGRCMTEMKNFLRQHIQSKIKEHRIDITFEMLEIMACLWNKDGINQQELADITIKDKSSMTYLVDNLVKRNMVSREPDTNDRRNNLICLTKEGKFLQKKLHPWILEMYDKAAFGSQQSEIEKSIKLIKRMTGNLKDRIAM